MADKHDERMRLFGSLLGRTEVPASELEDAFRAARESFQAMTQSAELIGSWLTEISSLFMSGRGLEALETWVRLQVIDEWRANIGLVMYAMRTRTDYDSTFFKDLFDLPEAWQHLHDSIAANRPILEQLISVQVDSARGQQNRWFGLTAKPARSPNPDYPYPMVSFSFHTALGEEYHFTEDVDDLIDSLGVLILAAEEAWANMSDAYDDRLKDHVRRGLHTIGEAVQRMLNPDNTASGQE